jgi:threonine dehydrogenase-like Zn-dependent dehydrogenase
MRPRMPDDGRKAKPGDHVVCVGNLYLWHCTRCGDHYDANRMLPASIDIVTGAMHGYRQVPQELPGPEGSDAVLHL